MNTTTMTEVRPFGMAVAAPGLRRKLAALMTQYGYEQVYPITEHDGDDDTAVVLRADGDHRLYLTASAGYADAEGLRWPVLFDTSVMRPHEIAEPGLFLGLVMTLGTIAGQLDALPGPSAARVTCRPGCGMQMDPAVGCCWCAGGESMLPEPKTPGWYAQREALRAATLDSRRECQICNRNGAADPEWHGHRFGHAPVMFERGRLLEFDGKRFARAVAINPDGTTRAADEAGE